MFPSLPAIPPLPPTLIPNNLSIIDGASFMNIKVANIISKLTIFVYIAPPKLLAVNSGSLLSTNIINARAAILPNKLIAVPSTSFHHFFNVSLPA